MKQDSGRVCIAALPRAVTERGILETWDVQSAEEIPVAPVLLNTQVLGTNAHPTSTCTRAFHVRKECGGTEQGKAVNLSKLPFLDAASALIPLSWHPWVGPVGAASVCTC